MDHKCNAPVRNHEFTICTNRYPESRMRHLLDIMSSTVGQSVQRELRAIGIWEEGFAKVRPELISGLRLCESWCKACEELIFLWKDNTEGRSWVGFDYKDEFVLLLGRRLQEILTLRQTREELSRLLSGDFDTENDQKQMQNARSATLVGSLGKYFAGIDPLLCSHYTDSAWSSFQSDDAVKELLKFKYDVLRHRAVEKYEKSLAPLDFQIAANFRQMISPLHETPLPLLHELRQFKHLLSRCNIRRALVSEREALLHQLVDMIENMGENFHVLIHDAIWLCVLHVQI